MNDCYDPKYHLENLQWQNDQKAREAYIARQQTCDHKVDGQDATSRFGDGTARCGVCDLPIGVPCAPEPANDTPPVNLEIATVEFADNAFGVDVLSAHGLALWFAFLDDLVSGGGF